MQMQDKAKGTQAKYSERVSRSAKKNNFLCLFPKRHNADTQVDARKQEATKLSNVNMCIVSNLSMNDAFMKHGLPPPCINFARADT